MSKHDEVTRAAQEIRRAAKQDPAWQAADRAFRAAEDSGDLVEAEAALHQMADAREAFISAALGRLPGGVREDVSARVNELDAMLCGVI
jgi:hypothetical protein